MNIRGLVFRKMTEEIWKDIPGYEGVYLVSNYARFLRVHDGKMLHPSKNHANYDVISFRRKQFRVARVVCTAFKHDRDLLAANNIKRFAFRNINTVGTTEIYACGDMSEHPHSAQEAHESSVRG